MTEVPPEQPVLYIHSALWKAAMLSTDSTFFPRLVEAAAWSIKRPYSDHLLRWVSTDKSILEELHIPINEGVDAVLTEYVTNLDQAEILDQLIITAVIGYDIPPEPEDPEDPEVEYQVWVRPINASFAYPPNEIVWYPEEGTQLYRNTHFTHNAWEPGTPNSQWEPYSPAGGDSS